MGRTLPPLRASAGCGGEFPARPSTLSTFRTCTRLDLENTRKERWPNTVRTRPDQAPQVSGCSPSLRWDLADLLASALLQLCQCLQRSRIAPVTIALAKPGPTSPDCTLPPRVFFLPHLSRPRVGRRMWSPCCESPQACCCEWKGKVLPTNQPTVPHEMKDALQHRNSNQKRFFQIDLVHLLPTVAWYFCCAMPSLVRVPP